MLTLFDFLKFLIVPNVFILSCIFYFRGKIDPPVLPDDSEADEPVSTEPAVDSECKAVITSSKQFYFNGSYTCQAWSLPDSLIYYIMKNPASTKVQQKIVQTCKYFYAKNPIIVAESLYFDCSYKIGELSLDNAKTYIELANVKCKFWITDLLDIYVRDTPSDYMSLMLPRFHQLDVTTLKLSDQILTFNEFLFLSRNVEKIVLNECYVMKQDGLILSMEELIECLPKIKSFQLIDNFSSMVTKNTVAELIKIPHFSNITQFKLINISEAFDIETFVKFIKKHTDFQLVLTLIPASEAYKFRIVAIMKEILETEERAYKTPLIYFDGLQEMLEAL